MQIKKFVEFRVKALGILSARSYLKLNQKSRDELKKQCPEKHFSELMKNVALIEKRGWDVLISEAVESFLQDSEDVVIGLKQDNSINPDCFKFKRVR